MKLHIGCGTKYLSGFKHLDIIKFDHVDYEASADDLSMFVDNSIDEIYACHILEHFGRNQVNKVIAEWSRVLKPGGILRVAVPDFDAIVQEYCQMQNLDTLIGLLYGGQNYAYNYHYMTFNLKTIVGLFTENNFEDVQRYNWQQFLPEGFDDFSRSYLPHMDVNGRLMSLNVIGRKKG